MGFSILLFIGIVVLIVLIVSQFNKLKDKINRLEWEVFTLNKLLERVKR